MIQITCEICMDLIPLVQDGVAAGDSVSAVEQHIQSCPQCRAMWEGQIPHSADSGRILEKVRHRTRVFMGIVLMFGIFFGLSLTAGSGLFLDSLSMPVIHRLLPVPLEIPVSYPVPSLCHPSGHKCSQNVPGDGAFGPGLPPAVVCAVCSLCGHRDGDRRPAAHRIPKD